MCETACVKLSVFLRVFSDWNWILFGFLRRGPQAFPDPAFCAGFFQNWSFAPQSGSSPGEGTVSHPQTAPAAADTFFTQKMPFCQKSYLRYNIWRRSFEIFISGCFI